MDDILKFSLAWAALTIMPGPDMIFVLTESVKNGSKNGIRIALGLCSGLAFHSAVVLTGFSLVISKSTVATTVVKYLGALYLVYIGISAIISAWSKAAETQQTSSVKLGYNPYLRGVIMNITNPKLMIFFLSFLPQFIDIESSTVWDSLFIFSLTVGIALPIFCVVALFAGGLSKYINLSLDSGVGRRIFALCEMSIYFVIAFLMVSSDF